ncbi:DNA-directed RNA polymerase I subunit RPA1-like isoform X2 [Gordionus sp. m RMFG-2023]|uniref:DNA-directed RNA polymerase I subunit RPA1-like isoform X2 n=1 Tax=Gordionus sp. m RMFG-2023 TaxID=3053472 RepID=UPI0031FD564C
MCDIQMKYISKVTFNSFKDDEIKKISVVEIINPKAIDRDLKPTPRGLHDLAMGPVDYKDICITCGLNYYSCPGHIGHIELPLIIYNPSLIKVLYTILRGSCLFCYKLLAPSIQSFLIRIQTHLIDQGMDSCVKNIKDIILKPNDKDINNMGLENFDELENYVKENTYLQSILANNKNYVNLTKNTNELKSSLLYDYIKKYHLGSSFKSCTHCHSKLPSWRLKEGSKILLSFIHKRKDAGIHNLMLNQPNELINNYDNNNENPLMFVDPQIKGEQELTPLEANRLLIKLLENEQNLNTLSIIFGCIKLKSFQHNNLCPHYYEDIARMFFIKTLPVIPSKFRPINSLGDSKYVTGQTLIYVKILAACQLLSEIMKIDASTNNMDALQNEKVDKALRYSKSSAKFRKNSNKPSTISGVKLPAHVTVWRYMQSCVNLLLENDPSLFPREKLTSIKQILEKKEGLFRKHMMGKRVDFAARSVISPDPFIDLDQIGIPLVFACKLTFPEPVNAFNLERLRRAIINGPDIYPGAFTVKNARGNVLFIDPKNVSQRLNLARKLTSSAIITAIDDSCIMEALNDSSRIVVVNRHLMDGDLLLLNRQPTLHKPSIMAHKAKILPAQRTLRLHYAHCKAYNADFDGDEMNAHFPQDYLGVAEGHYLAGCQHNYLTSKDGTPLTGLIQDHLIAGVLLTNRGKFFDRRDYQDLIYKAFGDRAVPNIFTRNYNGNTISESLGKRLYTIKPAILKPKVLWSGKQIISTVLLNSIGSDRAKCFNMYNKKSKVTEDLYCTKKSSKMDDRNFTSIHLDILSKHHLSEDGALVRNGYWIRGIFDKSHFGASPFGLIHCCQELYGGQIASDILTVLGKLFTSYLQINGFSLGIKDLLVTDKADKKRKKLIKSCDNIGKMIKPETFLQSHELLRKIFGDTEPLKAWRKAFYSRDEILLNEWEKGSKRFVDTINNQITEHIMGNGLIKSFPCNNLLLMVNSGAKGTLVNCVQICSTLGQIELEGKRPPVLITGRSLPSFSSFDPNPKTRGFVAYRFLTGLKPQDYFFHCMAGREGLIDTAVKTSHSGYLQRCLIKHLEGIKVCYDSTVRDSDNSIIQFLYGEDGLEVTKCQYLKNKSQVDFLLANHSSSNFMFKHKKSLYKSLKSFNGEMSENLQNFIKKNYSSHQSITKGHKNIYESNNCHNEYPSSDFPPNFKDIKKILRFKNAQSLVSPGEAVGLLAAQSVGEPSTQMTLNTFHFAGRGEMNVTLGIPRLREILMTATRDLKTPVMSTPLKMTNENSTLSLEEERGEELKLVFSRVAFSEVLENIEVNESITTTYDSKNRKKVFWIYEITFRLLPISYLSKILPLKGGKKMRKKLCSHVASQIESRLLSRLVRAINKENGLLNNIKLFESHKKFRTFTSLLSQPDDSKDQGDTNEDGTNEMEENKIKRESSITSSSDEESGEEDKDQIETEYPNDYEEATNDTQGEQEISGAKRNNVKKKRRKKIVAKGSKQDMQKRNKKQDGSPDTEADSSTLSSALDNSSSSTITGSSMDSDGDIDEQNNEGDYYRATSMPSSTTSGFSDSCPLLSEEHEEDSSTKNNISIKKRGKSKNVNKTPKNNKETSEMQTNYYYDKKVDDSICRATLQVPLSDNKIDMEAILEKECKNGYIYEISGVTSSSISRPDPDTLILNVEGINFNEIFKYGNVLDLNKLYCNDLHKILEVYGIEACRNAIIKEIQNVFSVYGIKVDYRHLSLIADQMTNSGHYKAFNRFTLANNTSPFLKMSFESTTSFLMDSFISGSSDYLQTPSACLVMGNEIKTGTGCFDLFQNLSLNIR